LVIASFARLGAGVYSWIGNALQPAQTPQVQKLSKRRNIKVKVEEPQRQPGRMAADVSKHLERAKRFLEKNRVEDAIEAYLAVLEEAPQHQEATQALGDLYSRTDQPEQAAIITACCLT